MRGDVGLDQGSSWENHERWSDSEYILKLDLIRYSNEFDEDYMKEKSRIIPSLLPKQMNDGAIF